MNEPQNHMGLFKSRSKDSCLNLGSLHVLGKACNVYILVGPLNSLNFWPTVCIQDLLKYMEMKFSILAL